MADPNATELLETLRQRRAVLDALADDAREQPELVAATGNSKSTIYRAVKELQTAGLVEYGDGGYRLTTLGTILQREFERFLTDVEQVAAAAPLLSTHHEPARIDIDVLRGAEVVAAADADSAQPGHRLAEITREATNLRLLTRAQTQSNSVEVMHEGVFDRGIEITAVATAQMLAEQLPDPEPRLAETMRSERFDLYRVEDLPFGLALVERGDERVVVVMIYDDEQFLRGILVNDTDASLAWAEARFEHYLARAKPVDVATEL